MGNILPFAPTRCAALYRRSDELTRLAQNENRLLRWRYMLELKQLEIELRALTVPEARQRKQP